MFLHKTSQSFKIIEDVPIRNVSTLEFFNLNRNFDTSHHKCYNLCGKRFGKSFEFTEVERQLANVVRYCAGATCLELKHKAVFATVPASVCNGK